MNRQSRLARLEDHHAYVEALVRRAGDLERRGSAAGAEHIRLAEARRDDISNGVLSGGVHLLNALDTLIAAAQTQITANRNLHRVIVEIADAGPQVTRWQRWRLRRNLTKAVALMERAVATMEHPPETGLLSRLRRPPRLAAGAAHPAEVPGVPFRRA